jgi:hypothetical protein
MELKEETCNRCGAKIFWARTENNKAMPVNLRPSATGNMWIVGTQGKTPIVHVRRKGEVEPDDGFLYNAHFISCRQQAGGR